MKKLMIVIVVALALTSAGWYAITRTGAGDALGEWVARQVVAIAEAYIVPDVEFDGFRYRSPGTLELTGVTLTAPDGTEVVRAGLVVVTLAETPSMNKPLAIEAIVLKDATLRLQTTADGFKGLVPFVEGEAIEKPESVDENLRLSRVFRIRSLTLENGSIEYDDGTGAPPMILSGLTLTTGVQPGSGGDEGWYAIDTETTAGDKSLAHMSAKGRLNIDSMAAHFERVALSMRLDESTYQALPPQVQKPLRDYEARGQLDVMATGDVSLTGGAGTSGGRLETKIAVKEFSVASGEYRFPIDSAEFPITISEGRATMPEGTASLLGGTLRIRNLSAELSQAGMPARLEWDAQSLDLQKMLRVATPQGEPPKLAGIVASSGSASTALSSPNESLSGSGVLTLREGRLIVLPIVKQFAEAMGVFNEATKSMTSDSTVDASFDLKPAGIELTQTTVDTPFAVARGTGTIGFDGSLDLMVNAGPMEKAQGLFGKLGDAIGKVTDKLVKYHVTGRVGEPKIKVRPLGL